MSEDEGHPVISGLLALVGVGVVVGMLVSGGALAVSSVLGLGEDDGGEAATSQQSMYLPKPSATESEAGPQITLRPGEESASAGASSAAPEFPISLSSTVTTVGPMEEIYLTGVYPGGEGAVVQVQRFESGRWEDFATVDAVVSGETFSTYVQTAQTGVNKFRVRNTDGPEVSNEVRVRVG